ncbi:hypothetical protein [Spartinivicinus poritis]|uniref:Uncharacterized protein n=1 Tax=Spartinivicinus poritis TaxID=2994640 RepID=A0ABT5U9K7_9GAMM|nr:hypothetical protein [Spartinivicinus sp. A2-2]MDE1463061.1 hypothetical protein [Spartinivicinus sp. A2-2]
MRKYVCIRALNLRDAKLGLANQNATIVRSNVEQVDPAFRNLVYGLEAQGLKNKIDECPLFCFLVEDKKGIDFNQFNEVEVSFPMEWFESAKSTVRHLTGLAYCEATSELANGLELKDQSRKVVYQRPKAV